MKTTKAIFTLIVALSMASCSSTSPDEPSKAKRGYKDAAPVIHALDKYYHNEGRSYTSRRHHPSVFEAMAEL